MVILNSDMCLLRLLMCISFNKLIITKINHTDDHSKIITFQFNFCRKKYANIANNCLKHCWQHVAVFK